MSGSTENYAVVRGGQRLLGQLLRARGGLPGCGVGGGRCAFDQSDGYMAVRICLNPLTLKADVGMCYKMHIRQLSCSEAASHWYIAEVGRKGLSPAGAKALLVLCDNITAPLFCSKVTKCMPAPSQVPVKGPTILPV